MYTFVDLLDTAHIRVRGDHTEDSEFAMKPTWPGCRFASDRSVTTHRTLRPLILLTTLNFTFHIAALLAVLFQRKPSFESQHRVGVHCCLYTPLDSQYDTYKHIQLRVKSLPTLLEL